MTKEAADPALALKTRIAEIDGRFDSAMGWGALTVWAANERERLVNRLKREFEITVPHNHQRAPLTAGASASPHHIRPK
jgi:hypothetical protein